MTLAYVLFALSAIAKALMDACKINAFPESWTWFNENTSWENKWKYEDPLIGYAENENATVGEFKYAVIFNDNPKRVPRFFGSTTFLVWVTDGWHFFQMLFLNFAAAGVCVQFGVEWWLGVIGTVAYKVIFQGAYSLLKLILK